MRALPSYFKIHAILLVISLIGFVGFNLVVDPEGRFALFSYPGFNQEKTEAMENGGRIVKSRALENGRYDTVILGSSRAENGIDPLHPAFADKRVYNAGLSATNMYEIARIFDFVRKTGTIKTVIFGMDFHLFSRAREVSGDFFESRFATETAWLSDLHYLASPHTFFAAWTTVKNNRAGRHSLYTLQGLRDRSRLYQPTRTNHRELFIKILTRNFLVSPETYGGFIYGEDRLELLRSLIAACRKDGVALYLFITPSHARDIEAVRALGLYPFLEQWKQELVRIVADDAAQHPQDKPIPLWDFSGYTSITTEDIPSANEQGKPMQWYWESSHFKKELGDLVLNRIFNLHDAKHPIPEDFGVLLSPDTIKAHLARTREQQQRYHETHASEVAEVEYLARITARFRSPKPESQSESPVYAAGSQTVDSQHTTSFFDKDTNGQ